MVIERCSPRTPETSDRHPFELPGATAHYAADRPVRAEHVRLELTLDFEKSELAGSCLTRLRAVREVDALTFDAVELEVESVRVDDKRTQFSLTDKHLAVALASPLRAGETAQVEVRYRCRPRRGLYFFGPDEGYPQRPRQAWTQGQDEDSRYWFPCLDSPAQKASTEVLATFPRELTGLSNGALVSDEVKGKLRTMHYRLDFPHSPYLITLAVGAFEEEKSKAGKVTLRTLFPKGQREAAKACVARSAQMLALFEELTGERYPYGSYSQVFVTDFIFGGMENTSATTLTDLVLADERARLDYSAESLIVHELAHQWFGDLLTCRDWPHGWLNEGFATYAEVLWKERADGVDEADQHRRVLLEGYLDEVSSRYARPIVARSFADPIDLFDRHLYEKGGLVLHELRRRLGDALFFKAIKHYVQQHKTQAVETIDLARAFVEATGHNIDRFFDQYVFAPGHPALKVEVRYLPGEQKVRVHVQQKQNTGPGGAAVFHLPLTVRVVEGAKASLHTLQLTDSEHTFFLPVSRAPTQLLVDPRREVLGTLKVDKPVEYWLCELKEAPEARARTEAAIALGAEGSPRAIEALGVAVATDAFWATQAAAARALGKVRTPLAKQALLTRLGVKHPKARRAVVAALGEFRRDAEVAAALEKLLKKGDPSYFVEGEAARSLGKLRLKGAVALLESVCERPAFFDAIAVGALDGLAETLDPAAYPIVERWVRYGAPEHARRAGLKALARLAEPAQKKQETVELLGELLRDPQFRIQMAACEAAQAMGDRRAIDSLESVPQLDGRIRRASREAVRSLRQGEPKEKEIAALREEVDRLKETTRAIKEKLEALALEAGPQRRGSPKAKAGRK